MIRSPELPPTRAAALQQGFVAMVKDPAFIEEASRLKLELSPIDGPAIVERLRKAAAAPRQVIDTFNRVVDLGRD